MGTEKSEEQKRGTQEERTSLKNGKEECNRRTKKSLPQAKNQETCHPKCSPCLKAELTVNSHIFHTLRIQGVEKYDIRTSVTFTRVNSHISHSANSPISG